MEGRAKPGSIMINLPRVQRIWRPVPPHLEASEGRPLRA